MTQRTMNQLYERSLYSPINYYLGLFTLLKEGADLDASMSEVPESLLGNILDIAGRHHDSNPEITDHQEAAIIRGMYEWGKSHATTNGRPETESNGQDVAKHKRRRSKPGCIP